jgi:hypothetical protein
VIAHLREAGHPFAERYVDTMTLEQARILAQSGYRHSLPDKNSAVVGQNKAE